MSGTFSLRADRVFSDRGEISDGCVEIADGAIAYVGLNRATDVPLIDLGDSILAAGFVDLHVHGNGGAWWGESPEKDREIARRMALGGTTACLASLGGRRSLEEVLDSIKTTAALVGQETEGSEVVGIHMEGPFINPEKKGAWMPEQLRRPNVEELRAMQETAGGAIKTMTIAPELPEALEAVVEARALGIRPAIGHTNATYEEAMTGIRAGMTMATHTFNAMRGLHHRDPGALGAVLASPEVDAELIADGQHVAAGAIEVLLAAKGSEKVILVTDNVAMAGLEPGKYGEGPWKVRVEDDGVTLADGTIAGSVIPFNRHVANAAEIAGLAPALTMASDNPAGAIGLDARKGSLKAGKDADIVVLSPEFEVRMTVSRGRIVYHDPSLAVDERMAKIG